MSGPITCLSCHEEVEARDLFAHLEEHNVSPASLEELLETIRATSLSDISARATAAAAARVQLDDAVASARAAGASWTEIGQAAGIARQSARERWSR